jgi:hypothetical protein
MRIDSSGNLLINTTDTTLYNNSGSGNGGIVLAKTGAGAGRIDVARDGNCYTANRLASDGNVFEFMKNGGAAVGSIGVDNGSLTVSSSASGKSGIYFGSGALFPMYSGSLDGSDQVSFGSPNYQFKDLHLSGTAHLTKTIDEATLPSTPANHVITLQPPTTTARYGGGISWSEGSNTAASINTVDAGSGGALHLAFSTGSNSAIAERLRLDTSGNLLVNGTNATAKLVVDGAANSYTTRFNSSTTTGQAFGARIRAGTNSSDFAVLVENTSASSMFAVRGDGNVGIGTSSPAQKLHVVGTTRPALIGSDNASNIVKLYNSATGSGSYNGLDLLVNSTSNAQINAYGMPLTFGTSASNGTDVTERMRIDSSGNVAIGNTSAGAKLDVRQDSGTAIRCEDGSGGYFVVQHGGSVGIGTSSPASNRLLHVSSSPQNQARFERTGASTVQIEFHDSTTTNQPSLGGDGDNLTFRTSFAERMRIDSSGNLLVGTTDSSLYNNSTGTGVVLGLDDSIQAARANDAPLLLNRQGTDGSIAVLYKDGAEVGSIATVASNMYLGTGDTGLYFNAGDDTVMPINVSTASGRDAGISLGKSNTRFKDLYLSGGTYITGSVPRLQFNDSDGTNTRGEIRQLSDAIIIKSRNGTSNGVIRFSGENGTTETEYGRFDASGILLVGKTAVSGSTAGVQMKPAGELSVVRDGNHALILNRLSSDGSLALFQQASTTVGSISVTSSATAYNTSSDQRLKDNIVDAPSASDDIDAIQVRSFDWKADGSHQKYGMVAQELQSVAPEAVTGDADSDDMMGVDYSKLVPMLVKEIQSLRARVAQLEGAN